MYFRAELTMENQTVATNKKAYHEFHILDKYEAGIELKGSEVKSLREGLASLKEGYVVIRKNQAWLSGMHINAYSHTGFEGHAKTRTRRLLLHKKEILKITQKLAEKGLTAVPLKMYFKDNWIKVEIGIARGKKLYDKRESKKKRDLERDLNRQMRLR